MQVVMALVTDSPYRTAVIKAAGNLASLLQGRLRLSALAQLCPPGTVCPAPVGSDDQEGLTDRIRRDAVAQFHHVETGEPVPVEAAWLGGPPMDEALRDVAECDFGVVGKTFRGELTGGQGLSGDVEHFKQWTTKPVVIVPEAPRPIGKALFVYTEHPESGHALSLAQAFAERGVDILLVTAIPPMGRTELTGTGAAYLKRHDVPFDRVDIDCVNCQVTGGPAEEVLGVARDAKADLIVMGGTRRSLLTRLLWPEMAHEVAWNATVPVLIWY